MSKNKAHILVVDDDVINQQVLHDTIEDLDYDVTVAESGLDAIEKINAISFDLILLDVMMPGLDGFETCFRIKQIESAEDIPIIFLTARSSSADIIKGFEKGAIDYISKPINNNVLISRINAHLALKMNTDYLEEEVRKRTIELENKNQQLEDALAKASAAEDAKRAFTANMCHELRTPLNGILGTHELLLNESLGGVIQEMVELSHNSSLALITIINDILHFTEMKNGVVQLETGPFKPQDLFKEISDVFAMKVKEAGLDFSITILENVPEILVGDARRIRQVTINLLGNAVKFTRKGSVSLSVLYNLELKQLSVTIADTGIGISEEDQGRLFQTFKQLDDSFTKSFGGIGIGLVNAQSLIELMQGELQFSSTLGEGSTFVFKLPLEIS